MIPIARPQLSDEECENVIRVLRSGNLAQGHGVEEFEHRFADIIGVPYAVAVSSGTTALHLALLAHGIGAGDEVIVPSFSFVATANVTLYVGAVPVFADIEPGTMNIDPNDVEAKITPRTKAVIAVHLYGNPANLARLTDICERHSLVLIEDACQAHAATYDAQPVGSFGTGCFSFYPTKNVTSGEGGMITTSDPYIADRARLLRAHGSPRRYVHEILGYNFRMTDIHAAIGITQLDHLSDWTARRQANANELKSLLGRLDLSFQETTARATHVYHQFTIRIPYARDAVSTYLRDHGVGCEVYYPIPIHQQPLYLGIGYDESLPVTEVASQQVLSLPVHPSLSGDDLQVIASTLSDALEVCSSVATPAD